MVLDSDHRIQFANLQFWDATMWGSSQMIQITVLDLYEYPWMCLCKLSNENQLTADIHGYPCISMYIHGCPRIERRDAYPHLPIVSFNEVFHHRLQQVKQFISPDAQTTFDRLPKVLAFIAMAKWRRSALAQGMTAMFPTTFTFRVIFVPCPRAVVLQCWTSSIPTLSVPRYSYNVFFYIPKNSWAFLGMRSIPRYS